MNAALFQRVLRRLIQVAPSVVLETALLEERLRL